MRLPDEGPSIIEENRGFILMGIFSSDVQKQLQGVLNGMVENVTIVYFTQEIDCDSCSDELSFVEEISGLSDKLNFLVHDLQSDREYADELGVDKVPAIVLLDSSKKDTGVKFYGIPGGYEINSFISALLEISGKKDDLPSKIMKKIKKIDRDIHVQVLVSLTCPVCPAAVRTAHRLAIESSRVKSDMVDAMTFPHLAQKYNVTNVPKIIINEEHEFVGAESMKKFLDIIEKTG